MVKGRIIYVDEDPEDIMYFQDFTEGVFELEAIQVVNDTELADLVDEILDSPPDALVTDFMLNEKATVGFNGQGLIEALQKRNKHIPCFLLTSHAPDAIEATHDARLVQTKGVMLGGDDLRSLFISQIAKVIKDHKAEVSSAEEELSALLEVPTNVLNAEQRQRIVYLDTYLEEHGLASDVLPGELKSDRSVELLVELISQVDVLLRKDS